MKPAPDQAHPASPPGFADGLGVRTLIAEKAGEGLEQLRIEASLAGHPAFEPALRERVSRLANFRHAYYARVRRVERVDGGAGLVLVSEYPVGARLSQVLAVAERCKLDLDINAALCLIRQLVPAVAMLHQNARDVAHGALAPERIVVTSHARVVITDYVFGSAIEQLNLSRERLWRDLRIAVPPGAGQSRLDHRADVTQLGVIALSLVLGRPLRGDELRGLADLVTTATESTVLGRRELISAPLRRWLLRMLQLDSRGSFESATDAQQGLEDVLSDEGGYIAAPVALETFLTAYYDQALQEEPVPAPPSAPAKPREGAVPPAPRGGRPSQPLRVIARKEPEGRDEPPPLLARGTDAAAPEPRELPGVQPVADAPLEPAREPAPPPASESGGTAAGGKPRGGPDQRASVHGFLDELERDGSLGETMAPGVERGSAHASTASATQPRRWERIALLVAVVVALAEGAFIWWKLPWGALLPATSGTVTIESRPLGVSVLVDGEPRGTTPVSVALPQGPHVIELRGGSDARVLPITVKAGVSASHYFELPSTQVTGALQVTSDVAGARVLVDGQLRGTAPVTVTDLAAGDHEVVLESRAGRIRQMVAIRGGVTSTLGLPEGTTRTEAATGWVSIKAPYEMQVLENGRVIGTTAVGRIELTPGPHRLEIVSDTLAYRTTADVDVVPGRTIAVPVRLPRGSVSINATPWAEVWVDGEKVGETPIGNLQLTIGPHEVTFRHPELGEQHHAISVTAASPVRLSVEMGR